MEADDSETLLGSMPVPRALFKLAVPAVAAQLINILYNLVDKMFIGRIPGAGSQALAGVGVTTPVILAISAFAALVSMGGAPKASIYLGKGDHLQAEKVLGSCTWMLLLLSFLITAIILIFGRPILLLFGASTETIGYAVDYMNIYCLGTAFTQLTLGLNAFITAQGKTLVSMRNVSIGAFTNIVLDALFINGFQMGVRGAAIATVISQGVSAFFVIRWLCPKDRVLRLRPELIRFDRRILWPCILLGASPALMQLTENLVAISFNTALQWYGGDMAVASMSILNSVMQFVMLLLPGLVQGAQPLLSYNLGAKNIPRVKKTFRLLLFSCLTGSFLIWLLCMTAPGTVAGIFTNNAELIQYSRHSMRIYLAMLLIYGIQVACQYSFVALDQARAAIFLTIWRKIILLIPLIFLLPHVWPDPTTGVYLAEPVADTIAVCTTAPMFYCYYRKLK
ncbi:MATE family efflux transporter [Clostridium vitabionis]|uniref:MATE family efflux transporter n=1 Tax=Clostridium vitabionis TaxID=2784388 RepID=UPI00188D63B6|nr:MATE family efflux transporter [Clostridium vitabionis]